MRPRHVSLRTLLLLLVSIAMLPVAGIVIHSGRNRHELALRNAMQITENQASTGADQLQRVVDGLHQLLTTLAELPQVRSRNPKAANQLLAGLQRQNERVVALFAVGRDGQIISAHSTINQASVKDRKYFQEAMKNLRFSAGDFVIGHFSGKRLLHFALPVIDGKTSVNSILVGAIDITHPNSLVGNLALPKGTRITLMDRTGTELGGADPGPDKVGFPTSPARFQALARISAEGTHREHLADGSYLVAVRSLVLPSEKTPYLVIKVAVPEEVALAEARWDFQRNLMLLLVVAAGTSLAAWLLGNRMVARPILLLAQAADRLGHGQLETRCEVVTRAQEINGLAHSIDAMADALQARDREREASRTALLQSQQLLDLFFSQSLDGFYIAIADHPIRWDDTVNKDAAVEDFLDHMRIQRVNAAMLAQYQAVESDFLGKPIRTFFSHDLDSARTSIRKFLDTGRMQNEALEFKPDGTPIWIEGDYLCMYEEAGWISGHFGIQHDVTERRMLETTLRENEERVRMLFDAVNDAVFVHDLASGQILDVNQKTMEMFGYTREEILRMDVGQLSEGVPPFTQTEAMAHIQRAANGDPQLFEWRGRHKSGQVFWVQANMRRAAIKGENRLMVTVRDIDDRKSAESALQHSEERYQGLFLHSPDSIFWIAVREDGTFVVESINPAQEALIGFKNQEITGKQLQEFLPAELAAGITAHYQECVENGRPVTYEEEVDLGAGLQYFQTQLVPIRDDTGRIHRLAGVSKDVSARRSAENALRGSQEMFRAIFDQAFQLVGLLDTEGTLIQVNQTSLDFMGLSEDQVIGRPFWETPWWKDSESDQKTLREAIAQAAQGHLVRFETTHKDKDGTLHNIDFSLKPFTDPTGKVRLLIPEGRDITERKQTEESLRERQQLFQLLFEHSGDANLLLDGGLFVDCNEATLRLLGAQHKVEILNTHPSQLSPEFQPDGRPSMEKAEEMIATAFRLGSLRFEWLHKKLDGTLLPVDVMLTAVPWKGKWILHTAWRDLTDSRRAEEERRNLESQMQQAQRLDSLGVLAGGIAHDFNNLLTALLGNLNLAHMSIPEDAPAAPYLHSAENAVMRASELTQQMLAYSGKGRFVVKLHNLNKVIQEMAHLMQVSIPKKISLVQFLAEQLPPIEADGAQIQQVILNLVTNAADAIGSQDGVITVSTELLNLDSQALAHEFPAQSLTPGPYVCLEVRDTGCGILPETMARIFEPFFTTKPTGRGLGLSAMLGILRGHHAGIKIHSKVGSGSTFTLVFQAKQGNVEAAPTVALAPAVMATETILVVDDEPTILETAQAALEGIGYRVLLANDGLEAVERFRAEHAEIALVIMDLTMPRMDGREAFEAMLAIQPDVRVILTSGYSEQESVQQMLGRGLAGFLPKPYPISDLRKIVQHSLRPES